MFARHQANGIIRSMNVIITTFISSIISVTVLVGCLPSAAPVTAPPPAPSATPVLLYATGAQNVAPTGQIPPATPASSSTPIPASPSQCPPENTTPAAARRYDIEAVVDYSNAQVSVVQVTTFRNMLESPLNELIFYVAPNKQPGLFHLSNITLPDTHLPPPATLEGVTLTVPLPTPLHPGCEQRIRLAFTLDIPIMGNAYFPRQGYLGYTETQLNLGMWFPMIAYHDGIEWRTPTPINIGEQAVLPVADFAARLYVRNAPDTLTVVGPGDMRHDGMRWTFALSEARDLVISMSPQYHVQTTTTESGVDIEVYTLNDAQPDTTISYDAPGHALTTAAQALELYAGLYGAYPYDRLAVIESVFPDGMEFSGLVFVGGEWFRSYDGDPAAYLTLITAHEVAHQWWYHRVANDQSLEPWLDEALAIYNEYVYLQENYPDLTDWWWAFRVNSFDPQGAVDATVYEFDTLRGYINAVYLRGAQMMHALRAEIGTEAFFTWLQDYANASSGQVVTAEALWSALPENLQSRTASIRQQFLRNPGP